MTANVTSGDYLISDQMWQLLHGTSQDVPNEDWGFSHTWRLALALITIVASMIQALTIQHKRTAHGISLGYVTALAGLTILQLAYYVFGFVDVPDTTFPDFELDPRPLVFLKPTLTELMCGAQLMAQFLGSFFMAFYVAHYDTRRRGEAKFMMLAILSLASALASVAVYLRSQTIDTVSRSYQSMIGFYLLAILEGIFSLAVILSLVYQLFAIAKRYDRATSALDPVGLSLQGLCYYFAGNTLWTGRLNPVTIAIANWSVSASLITIAVSIYCVEFHRRLMDSGTTEAQLSLLGVRDWDWSVR